jgi:hypothetical protein
MLNKFLFPKSWGFKRTPIRPTELQVLNFDQNYDYDTVWNDIIQLNQQTLLLIGPPLYSVANWIMTQCQFIDSVGNTMQWQYHEMDRVAYICISTTSYHKEITLKTPYDEHVLYVDYPRRHFENQKVIVTISKNHPIEWLKQWIDYHRVVHNVEGVLLYNNRSTIYTTEELSIALQRRDMTVEILDYDVPFGAMGGGTWEWQGKSGDFLPWDSDFSQYVMLEHAKWKYLWCAKLAINADTDELLIVKNGNLDGVADYCATGEHSALLYDGVWIEPVDGSTGTIAKNIPPELRHFSHYWYTTGGDGRGIGVKWLLNPQRNLQYQWHLHKTYGPHVKTSEIAFGHFFAMNTNWSYTRDEFLGNHSDLQELSLLKDNLEKWMRGEKS